jgi:hypothetical protein
VNAWRQHTFEKVFLASNTVRAGTVRRVEGVRKANDMILCEYCSVVVEERKILLSKLFFYVCNARVFEWQMKSIDWLK